MRNLEEKMLEEVINAKYLVPIKLENNDLKIDSNGMNIVNKGNEVRFSIIKDKNGISWIQHLLIGMNLIKHLIRKVGKVVFVIFKIYYYCQKT